MVTQSGKKRKKKRGAQSALKDGSGREDHASFTCLCVHCSNEKNGEEKGKWDGY